jgi:hypothetical protein
VHSLICYAVNVSGAKAWQEHLVTSDSSSADVEHLETERVKLSSGTRRRFILVAYRICNSSRGQGTLD